MADHIGLILILRLFESESRGSVIWNGMARLEMGEGEARHLDADTGLAPVSPLGVVSVRSKIVSTMLTCLDTLVSSDCVGLGEWVPVLSHPSDFSSRFERQPLSKDTACNSKQIHPSLCRHTYI